MLRGGEVYPDKTSTTKQLVGRDICGDSKHRAICLRFDKTNVHGIDRRTLVLPHLTGLCSTSERMLKIWPAGAPQPSEPLMAHEFPSWCSSPGKQIRSHADFTRLIRESARAAGISGWEQYTPHSLRHGGASEAFQRGVPLDVIMRQGRWTSTSY